MNPARSGSSGAYTEGTGTIGGWEHCEMRSYLKNTIKPLIPSAVRSGIVEVTKISNAYNSADTAFQQTTTDDVWIPGDREIQNSTSQEQSGPVYNVTNKVKKCKGVISYWWLRSAASTSNFRFVTNFSYSDSNSAHYPYGIALGFCTN